MRRLIAIVVLVGCAGYRQAGGIDPANRSTVEVPMAVAPVQAQERAFAALVRAGFAVSDQRQGIITIGPYALAADPGVKVTIRVAIVADSAGSLAVVSGTLVEDAFGASIGRTLAGAQGAAVMEGQTIREATSGRNTRNWGEILRVAAALR